MVESRRGVGQAQLGAADGGGGAGATVPDPTVRVAEFVEKENIDVVFYREPDGVGGEAGAGGDLDGADLTGAYLPGFLADLDQEHLALAVQIGTETGEDQFHGSSSCGWTGSIQP